MGLAARRAARSVRGSTDLRAARAMPPEALRGAPGRGAWTPKESGRCGLKPRGPLRFQLPPGLTGEWAYRCLRTKRPLQNIQLFRISEI